MTNNRSSAPGDAGSIAQQAAEWFGRCEIGLTPEQETAFLRWLEADPRHGEAMREMDETWDFLDRLQESERLRTRSVVTKPRIRGAAWTAVTLAAAAAVALAFLTPRRSGHPLELERHAVTEPGGMKKIELPDGSIVHLNASSGIAVRYTAAERRVELLRGEGHFSVAKNPARPFVVVAGDVAVRAVGTAFDVRRAAQAVEVFVTEGKVRVDDAARGASLLAPARISRAASPTAAEPPLLVAGQRATISVRTEVSPRAAMVTPIPAAAIQAALAWRERQLDFDLTPLADVAAEFNRYNSHQLVIRDEELGRQPFGGSFRADNYDGFVRLLEQRFGVTAERAGESTILRRAR